MTQLDEPSPLLSVRVNLRVYQRQLPPLRKCFPVTHLDECNLHAVEGKDGEEVTVAGVEAHHTELVASKGFYSTDSQRAQEGHDRYLGTLEASLGVSEKQPWGFSLGSGVCCEEKGRAIGVAGVIVARVWHDAGGILWTSPEAALKVVASGKGVVPRRVAHKPVWEEACILQQRPVTVQRGVRDRTLVSSSDGCTTGLRARGKVVHTQTPQQWRPHWSCPWQMPHRQDRGGLCGSAPRRNRRCRSCMPTWRHIILGTKRSVRWWGPSRVLSFGSEPCPEMLRRIGIQHHTNRTSTRDCQEA
eukprot:1196079-Prorocentrum_minimum.AAC.3